jgi:hypothetical protein
LHQYSEHRAKDSTRNAHHRGLRDVHREHLRPSCPDAAQDRDRVDLARHERVYAACYAYSAEQQRDHPNHSNELPELVDSLGKTLLHLLGGAHSHIRPSETRTQRCYQASSIAGTGSYQRFMPARAAENDQLCLGQIPGGDEYARPDDSGELGKARRVAHYRGKYELSQADGYCVTDACIQRDQ